MNRWTNEDTVFAGAIVLFGLLFYLHELGSYPLRPWDEAIYADVARHMVQDGLWVVPHTTYKTGQRPSSLAPFLLKPPLAFWLEGLTMKILGVSEFAARLPSALAAVTTGGVVYYVGRELYDRRTALFAGLVFLTTPYFYFGFNGARHGGTDTLLVLGGTLFVAGVWFAIRDDRRWLYVGALGATIAVLTKGFAAGVFLLIVLPLVLANWRTIFCRHGVTSAGLALSVMIPWPLLMYLQFGVEFVETIFLEQVLGRVGGEQAMRFIVLPFSNYPYVPYLAVSPSYFEPWTVFLGLIALVIGVRAWQNRSVPVREAFLLWWVVFPVFFFTLTGGLGSYIMPIYVPASLLVGTGLARASRGDRAYLAVVGLSAVLGATFLVGFHFVRRPIYHLPIRLVGVLGLVAGIVVLSRWVERELDSTGSISLALACVVVAGALVGGTLPVPANPGGEVDEKTQDQYRLGMAASDIEESAVISVQSSMGVAFHTFTFYSGHEIVSEPIEELKEARGDRYAVVAQSNVSELSKNNRVTFLANESGEWANVSLVYLRPKTNRRAVSEGSSLREVEGSDDGPSARTPLITSSTGRSVRCRPCSRF